MLKIVKVFRNIKEIDKERSKIIQCVKPQTRREAHNT